MYDYIMRRLIEANLKKDINILDEVKGLVKDLKEAWSEALNRVRSKVYAKG